MANQRKWGAALAYVNISATMAVGLLYTPVMLRLLGQSEYGLYSLMGSLAGYLSVLDMGLSNTLVRFAAKNRVDGSAAREAELNGLFLAVYSGLGLLALAAGAAAWWQMDALFGETLTAGELARARTMLALLVFNVALSLPFSIFASVLQAYERFIFLRVTNILRVVLNPLLVLPFLLQGYGSVMMVVVSTVLNVLCLLSHAYYCFARLRIRFRWGRFSGGFLREIFSYSFFMFLNAIMDKVYWGTGQFVLGMVAGTLQVAVYAIAMQFLMLYMSFSCAISGVLLPKVTMMVAGHAKAGELTNLMIRVGRLQGMVVGYIFLMFLLLGQEFISLWAGNGYLGAYPAVLLLMAAMVIPLVQNVGISILLAMNRNRYRMTAYMACAAAAFLASFPLAERFGVMGCAAATAGALLVSTGFIMNRYYARRIGLEMGRFWRDMGKGARGMAVFLPLGIVLGKLLAVPFSWGHFVALAAVDTAVYAAAVYLFSMNAAERAMCRAWTGKFIR